MRTRQDPIIRSALMLTALVAVASTLGGCAGDSSARAEGDNALTAGEVRLNAEIRRERDLRELAAQDDLANPYAAQAERDIADWLAMESESPSTAELPGESELPSPSQSMQAQRPAVIFNEPGSVRARAADRVAAAPRPGPDTVKSGGGEGGLEIPSSVPGFTQPGAGQAPLFRDESAPLEVSADPARAAGEDSSDQPATARSTNVLLVDLRRALLRQSIESNQPLRELIAIAMTTYMDPDLALQPEAFRELTEDERVLLETLQNFFRTMHAKLDGSIPAEEAIIAAVLELEKALIQQPELAIPTATICWRVGGFGDYDTFDRMAFLAQSEQRIILYLEIDGFTSEQNKRGEWVTEVSQQLEIISDRDGIPVWTEPWQKATDVTSNRRRDFFTTQVITLPKALSVGKYNLKIRARDEKSGAIAERTIDFEMVADENLTGKMSK